MSESVSQTLDTLGELGTVGEMWDAACAGKAPASRPRVNAHVHLPPNFSAFSSVEQAVGLAAEQGVGVLGASNYYDFDVYGPFGRLTREKGIFPLFGIEGIALIPDLRDRGVRINDPGNPGKIYVCGKGIARFARPSEAAANLLGEIRANDDRRMAEMARRVGGRFAAAGIGGDLAAEALADQVASSAGARRESVTLQERHLARGFQEEFFRQVPLEKRPELLERLFGKASAAGGDDAVKLQGEIRSNLMKAGKPAFVDETFLEFPRVRQLILELGGIPCYPTLADGADPICQFETPVDALVDHIRELGLAMAELIPLRNEPPVLREYATALRGAGLPVVAGTEHNTLDLSPLQPQCQGGVEIDDDLKDLFWEGACVVAAHQFLVLHGECGFVDAAGEPNGEYADPDARIEAFASLGAAVIETYYQKHA